MIKFVVCDDEEFFIKNTQKIVKKILSESDLEYEIDSFSKYNKKLEEIISSNTSTKIYILDVELNDSISGIDIARKIRRTDWESSIIIVTSHFELGYEVLKAQIMLLNFISKYDNCNKNIEMTIRKVISKINNKKTLTFEQSGITYRIYLDDILYVEKDTVERKCLIKTTYNEVLVNKTLTEIIDELDGRFFLSHRSCLVNTEKIMKVDWKNGKIVFDNKISINSLARDKKKGLKEYVENH